MPDRTLRRRPRGALARVGAACVAALAALALGGCGLAGGDQPEKSGAELRTVVGIDKVQVEVPVDPQRVVTLSEPTLDGALALGIRPIGTTAGRGQSGAPNYLAQAAAGIPILGNIAQPNYEAIGDAHPDLILVDGTSINNNATAIGKLRKIAPTVVVGYAGGDWRATFTHTADALNRADQGAAVLADYDASVASAAEAIGDRSAQTFSVVRWQGNAPSLILKELPAGVALTDLGLRRPPSQDRLGRGHSEPVSLENLVEIDADWMFFGTLGGSSVTNVQAGGGASADDAAGALAGAAQTPGFTALQAYRSGHVVPVDGSVWTSTGGPLLMHRLVDDVVAALTGAAS